MHWFPKTDVDCSPKYCNIWKRLCYPLKSVIPQHVSCKSSFLFSWSWLAGKPFREGGLNSYSFIGLTWHNLYRSVYAQVKTISTTKDNTENTKWKKNCYYSKNFKLTNVIDTTFFHAHTTLSVKKKLEVKSISTKLCADICMICW